MMKTKFLESQDKYDGTQLCSLRNYLVHGMLGDSVVAWVGPCAISFEHMVDGEDLLEKAKIEGSKMLHFIVEKFDINLFSAVALQRLLAAIVRHQLIQQSSQKAMAAGLVRDGDDLYFDKRKLSISIATRSPTSSLIHFAVNVSNAGTPVPTLSLEDLGADPRKLAEGVMKAFAAEVCSIHEATQKVRWVK